jgi:hypothetical protein
VKRVFIDTGAFFAVLVRDDVRHEHARELIHQADAERWQLMTTNAVVFETHALLVNRSRAGRRDALAFLDMMERDGYVIERVRESDEQGAVALIRRHSDKGYSLCDAMSFVVMERLGITEAIAFDRHFVEYGRFTVL